MERKKDGKRKRITERTRERERNEGENEKEREMRRVEQESAGDAKDSRGIDSTRDTPGCFRASTVRESTTFDNFDNANYKTTGRATVSFRKLPENCVPANAGLYAQSSRLEYSELFTDIARATSFAWHRRRTTTRLSNSDFIMCIYYFIILSLYMRRYRNSMASARDRENISFGKSSKHNFGRISCLND